MDLTGLQFRYSEPGWQDNIMIKPWMFAPKTITWANWPEDSEASLAGGPDGANIFVCMAGGGLGADETGQGGGLTGVNLVLTQAGNIAAAAGGKRTLDGTDDEFLMTTAALDALICNSNKTWTLILKLDNITLTNADYFFSFSADPESVDRISANISATATITGTMEEDNVLENVGTVDALAVSTEYYVCMWADGINAYVGFTTTRPTKLSDFGANDRIIFSTNTGDFAGESFNSATKRALLSLGGSNFTAADWYYLVMAKTCLIDNAL